MKKSTRKLLNTVIIEVVLISVSFIFIMPV
ncbi:MAG TPA: carbohydrate ABC transporter permease, partial [Mesotoga infera]|nr:carbohydrate ABC transporter permease [Mesotoga infera]